jgi:D-serine deaminase-like pyridoxal phosphate-dependent protein
MWERLLAAINGYHGLIIGNDPIAFENYPVGSLLQIIPNHSCLTAALVPKIPCRCRKSGRRRVGTDAGMVAKLIVAKHQKFSRSVGTQSIGT